MMGVRMPGLKTMSPSSTGSDPLVSESENHCDDPPPPPPTQPSEEDEENQPTPPAPVSNHAEEKEKVPTSQPTTCQHQPNAAPVPNFNESDVRLWKYMLTNGSIFVKYKYGKGQKRMIWCSDSFDRILWGDEQKKKVKGYMMVSDITAIRDIAEGSKKKDYSLTIVSSTRLLELEAMDYEQKVGWIEALQWMIRSKA